MSCQKVIHADPRRCPPHSRCRPRLNDGRVAMPISAPRYRSCAPSWTSNDCALIAKYRTDLAAMALVLPSREGGRTTYATFALYYLNEAAVAEARNPSYPSWAATGHLVVTSGNETDFDEIESDVRQLCSRFQVISIGYDP